MQRHLGNSLKTRIVLVAGLLFLAGIAVISLVTSNLLRTDMQALLSKQEETAANYIARDIGGKLNLRLDSLNRVAGNIPPALFNDPAKLQAWLEDRRAIHILFPTGLMVIPPDGGPTLAETPRLKSRPKSFVDRDWFIAARQTRQPVISKPLITRATGEPALVMAIPIYSPEQQLIAILAGVTPLAAPGFLDQLNEKQADKNNRRQLIDRNSRLFVLTSDPGSAVSELPASGSDPIIDFALQAGTGAHLLNNASGDKELLVVSDVSPGNWRLLTRMPARDAFAAASNALANTWITAILLSFPVLAMLLAALNRLLRPLAQLANDLREMADGTRAMQPLLCAQHDEVAAVAQSFNCLQEKLLAQERCLAEMALRDPLTQLPNRLAMNDCLERELARQRRRANGIAVLFLDLDGFKPVNDTYGHEVGDQLLIEIAARLRQCARASDTVGRLGGDEFLICLSDTESPLYAGERLAEQCIATLRQPITIGAHQIRVGVSIGLAVNDNPSLSPADANELIRYADAAMYRAKANGRNRYAIYSPESNSPDYV